MKQCPYCTESFPNICEHVAYECWAAPGHKKSDALYQTSDDEFLMAVGVGLAMGGR